jgi:Double zinc ribbon
MDLSKLPRLSKTENPAQSVEAPSTAPSASPNAPALPSATRQCPQCQAPLRSGAKFCDSCGQPLRSPPSDVGPGVAAEAWISVGIGVLILLFFPTMMQFVSSKVLHTKFAPYPDGKDGWVDSANMTDANGTVEVRPYVKTTPENSPNFWNDLSITSFAWALIIEGIALVFSRRPMVVLMALLITLAATLLNLGYFVGTFNKYGLAPISGLAVIFGVYMCIFEFRLFQAVRSGTAGA